jgi:hypothetical protein
MVGISAFLGWLIADLIGRGNPPDQYLYCSNLNSTNSINLPYWDNKDSNITMTTSVNIPGAYGNIIYQPNWSRVNRAKKPCAFWFGLEYPFSSLYERDPKTVGNLVRDSSLLSKPLLGWFTNILTQNKKLDFSLMRYIKV